MVATFLNNAGELSQIWNENGTCPVRFVSVLQSIKVVRGEINLMLRNFDENETKKDFFIARLEKFELPSIQFFQHLKTVHKLNVPENFDRVDWSLKNVHLKTPIILNIIGDLRAADSYLYVLIDIFPRITNVPGNYGQSVNEFIFHLWTNLIRMDEDKKDNFSFAKFKVFHEPEKSYVEKLRNPQTQPRKIFNPEDIDIGALFSSDEDEEEEKDNVEALNSSFHKEIHEAKHAVNSESSLNSQYSEESDSEFQDATSEMLELPKKRTGENIASQLDGVKKAKHDATIAVQNYGQEPVALVSIATQTEMANKDIVHLEFIRDTQKSPEVIKKPRYNMVVEVRESSVTPTAQSTQISKIKDESAPLKVVLAEQHELNEKRAANSQITTKTQTPIAMNTMSPFPAKVFLETVPLIKSFRDLTKTMFHLSRAWETSRSGVTQVRLRGRIVGILPTHQMVGPAEPADKVDRLTFSIVLVSDDVSTASKFHEKNSVFVTCTDVEWLCDVLKIKSPLSARLAGEEMLLVDFLDEIYLKTPFLEPCTVELQVQASVKNGYNYVLVPYMEDNRVAFKKDTSTTDNNKAMEAESNNSFNEFSFQPTGSQRQDRYGSPANNTKTRNKYISIPVRREKTQYIKDIHVIGPTKLYLSVVGLLVSFDLVERTGQYAVMFSDFTFNNDAMLDSRFLPYFVEPHQMMENGTVLKGFMYADRFEKMRSQFTDSFGDVLNFQEMLDSQNVSRYGIFCRFDMTVKLYNNRLDPLITNITFLDNLCVLPFEEQHFLTECRLKFFSHLKTTQIQDNLSRMRIFTNLQQSSDGYTIGSDEDKVNTIDDSQNNNNNNTDSQSQDFDDTQMALEIYKSSVTKMEIPYRLDHSFIQTMKRYEGKPVEFITKVVEPTQNAYFEVLGRIVSAELINKDLMLKLRIADPVSDKIGAVKCDVFDNNNSIVVYVMFRSNMKLCFEQMNYNTFNEVVEEHIIGKNSQFRLYRIPLLTSSTAHQVMWVLLDFKISDIYDSFLSSFID
ncbi:hypothetical protein ACO0QE_000979 [Hanseniaspora vineae]